jgi:hypothetical protein
MVFNWHTNAWLVTPNVGLEWHLVEGDRRISVLGHTGWSRIRVSASRTPYRNLQNP